MTEVTNLLITKFKTALCWLGFQAIVAPFTLALIVYAVSSFENIAITLQVFDMQVDMVKLDKIGE